MQSGDDIFTSGAGIACVAAGIHIECGGTEFRPRVYRQVRLGKQKDKRLTLRIELMLQHAKNGRAGMPGGVVQKCFQGRA